MTRTTKATAPEERLTTSQRERALALSLEYEHTQPSHLSGHMELVSNYALELREQLATRDTALAEVERWLTEDVYHSDRCCRQATNPQCCCGSDTLRSKVMDARAGNTATESDE